VRDICPPPPFFGLCGKSGLAAGIFPGFFLTVRLRQEGDKVGDLLLTAGTVDIVEQLHHAGRATDGDGIGLSSVDVLRFFPADDSGCFMVREDIGASAAATGVRGRHLLKGDARDTFEDFARLGRNLHRLFQMAGIVIGHHPLHSSRGLPELDDPGEEGGDVIGPLGPVFSLGTVNRVGGQDLDIVVLPSAAAGAATGDQILAASFVKGVDVIAGQCPHRFDVAMYQDRNTAAVLRLGNMNLDVVDA
jgi:hypothetical protein